MYYFLKELLFTLPLLPGFFPAGALHLGGLLGLHLLGLLGLDPGHAHPLQSNNCSAMLNMTHNMK